MGSRRATLLLAGAVSLAACTDDGSGNDDAAPGCVEIDYTDCTQLYPPTWDQVWTQTLSSSCSGGGAACHANANRLSFIDQDTAYTDLTVTHAQIIAGDPQCSPLMIRLESEDPTYRMPPGDTPVSAGARCSIATWIEAGATQD